MEDGSHWWHPPGSGALRDPTAFLCHEDGRQERTLSLHLNFLLLAPQFCLVSFQLKVYFAPLQYLSRSLKLPLMSTPQKEMKPSAFVSSLPCHDK
jgi:hypothetical protein